MDLRRLDLRRLVWLWLPVVAWAGVIFAFSSVPSLNSGLGTWDHILRKFAHAAEYAVLAALAFRATRSAPAAFALAVAYAATDEVHQLWVRGRHGSPVDVAIDAIGALVGVSAARWASARARTL